MTKFLGVSMIVLGTIILLVSYLSQSCEAIAGLFPISWVDINGVQFIAFFGLIVGGLIAHVTAIKNASTKEVAEGKGFAKAGLGLAALALLLILIAVGTSFAELPEAISFISSAATAVYIPVVLSLASLYCAVKCLSTKAAQNGNITLGILALNVILALVASIAFFPTAA